MAAAPSRNRLVYACLVAVVIAGGLATRKYRAWLGPTLSGCLGDGLWALMVFLLAGIFQPQWSTRRATVGALVFSFLIEFSQLYHAPWIDAIRANWLGGLVLGYDFDWTDLLCYTTGIGLGATGERWLTQSSSSNTPNSSSR